MNKAMLTEQQKRYLDDFIDKYTQKTRASMQRREEAYPALADARSSQGYFSKAPAPAREFWLATKKLRYPIVADRCEGAYVWDIDGNQYVDFCMGFGVCLFGHRPAFLEEAISRQLAKGLPIGYQSERPNEVAARIAAMTGAERVAFCNTGAEAIMGAVRLARAATKRDKIAVFAQSYHGSYDATLPATDMTLGLSTRQRSDTLVLEWGSPRSLELIAENGSDLACVVAEAIQSRSFTAPPASYLKELRALTREKDIALVFDDILLGFRLHQGGTQAHFDIRADLAVFGKILGGGMPIGVITGSARYLDLIDGGRWSCHDDSEPSGEKVWFAGTFTKNPLTMAAAHAVTQYLEREGEDLQRGLNEKTSKLAARLNEWLMEQGLPARVEHLGSMFRFAMPPHLWVLLPHLRMRGVFAFDGMTFFVSTAHGDTELSKLEDAVKDSFLGMRRGGYIA